MSNLQYPNSDILHWWVEYLQTDRALKLALPKIDDEWYAAMIDVITRVQYSYSPDEVFTRGAEIFYNTIKAHNFLDGNKRSGILVVYLFFIINGYYIIDKLDVRQTAKKVARSRGRIRHDWWIKKLCSVFRRCTNQFSADET